jgi:hypothetical protein
MQFPQNGRWRKTKKNRIANNSIKSFYISHKIKVFLCFRKWPFVSEDKIPFFSFPYHSKKGLENVGKPATKRDESI